MESMMFNNNHRNFVVGSENGIKELTIAKAILYDDSSFLTHSSALTLKVFKDGIEVLNRHLSSYPLTDTNGAVAEINEKFTDFRELLIEVYDDNPLLSDELNFNLELEYFANKPVIS